MVFIDCGRTTKRGVKTPEPLRKREKKFYDLKKKWPEPHIKHMKNEYKKFACYVHCWPMSINRKGNGKFCQVLENFIFFIHFLSILDHPK